MRSRVLGEADDKSLFLSLLQKLVVELPPVSSPVDRIYPLGADMGADRVDHFEELVVLAFEVLRFLGVCLQVEGNDLLMLDICGHCFCQPVAFSYLVLAPVVDLAKALHLGGMLLPYVPRIDGDDHIIEDVPASQPAYLAVDLFGEIPVVEVSR